MEHRFRFWALVAGLAVLSVVALACRVSLSPASLGGTPPPQAQPIFTSTAVSSTSPAGESSSSPPALPPPMFPTVFPTAIPTWVPAPTPGVVSPVPLATPVFDVRRGIAAEVWDFPSGRYQGSAGRALYPKGGDVFAFNLYERPFREQDQAEFYPDLDIRYARLVRQGEWFYAEIRLHGLDSQTSAPQGNYGIEIDTNIDGRGDFLIWALGPIPNQWTPSGVEVYQDTQADVGGRVACQSDAPFQGDGYEHLVYRADPRTALAWVRWEWTQEGNQRYPAVLLAFHQSVLGTPPARFLWQAWADGGLKQPGMMDYHDQYARAQAGVPYPNQQDFPIKGLARMDNTCRAAFGFQLTGLEPCLCRNNVTAPVCPQPEEPPLEECEQTPDGLWQCVQGGELAQNVYCRWDEELCQWNCRPTRLCEPPGGVPPTSTEMDGQSSEVLTPNWPNLAIPLIPPEVKLVQGAYGILDILRPQANGQTTQCTWDPNLCRWQCNDVCMSIPEAPRPDCTYQGNETWLCDDGVSTRTVYRWNQDTCQWDTESQEYCPAPQEVPDAYPKSCKQTDPGVWECTHYTDTGVYVLRYKWNEKTCEWEQGLLCSRDPRETCSYDTEDTSGYPWFCSGRGEFKQCEWDSSQCRYRCWDPKPQPKKEEEKPLCQSETYCSLDLEIWYCNDGSVWSSCTYDGCNWNCR